MTRNPTICGIIPKAYMLAVKELVKKGLYANESDFVRQAVREKIERCHASYLE